MLREPNKRDFIGKTIIACLFVAPDSIELFFSDGTTVCIMGNAGPNNVVIGIFEK